MRQTKQPDGSIEHKLGRLRFRCLQIQILQTFVRNHCFHCSLMRFPAQNTWKECRCSMENSTPCIGQVIASDQGAGYKRRKSRTIPRLASNPGLALSILSIPLEMPPKMNVVRLATLHAQWCPVSYSHLSGVGLPSLAVDRLNRSGSASSPLSGC